MRPLAPEASVSTNFTTQAKNIILQVYPQKEWCKYYLTKNHSSILFADYLADILNFPELVYSFPQIILIFIEIFVTKRVFREVEGVNHYLL